MSKLYNGRTIIYRILINIGVDVALMFIVWPMAKVANTRITKARDHKLQRRKRNVRLRNNQL